jgi:hypothetical protein
MRDAGWAIAEWLIENGTRQSSCLRRQVLLDAAVAVGFLIHQQ